jgi:hypothetical protein
MSPVSLYPCIFAFYSTHSTADGRSRECVTCHQRHRTLPDSFQHYPINSDEESVGPGHYLILPHTITSPPSRYRQITRPQDFLKFYP